MGARDAAQAKNLGGVSKLDKLGGTEAFGTLTGHIFGHCMADHRLHRLLATAAACADVQLILYLFERHMPGIYRLGNVFVCNGFAKADIHRSS